MRIGVPALAWIGAVVFLAYGCGTSPASDPTAPESTSGNSRPWSSPRSKNPASPNCARPGCEFFPWVRETCPTNDFSIP